MMKVCTFFTCCLYLSFFRFVIVIVILVHVLTIRLVFQVEAKRALSREEQQVSKAGNPSGGRNSGGSDSGNMRTKKIFVGGLPATLSEEGFRQYFEAYGNVTDVVVMYDQQTNRPRGFGFISFDSEEAVDRVLHKTFHDLNGKQVEVKRALPKDANPGGGGGRSMGGGGGGGGYQGYGASGGNSSYEGRMDSNRYMQSQTAGGGFPPYGNTGYGTPGYGYGPGNNGMGYNSYGGYGGGNPGYGGPAGAPYGNPNVPSAGYGSGPSGPARGSWNSQPSSGYGGAGAYGNAPWGASVAGGGGGGGPQAAAPTGQSPSGAAGYGNQGYGYGGGYGLAAVILIMEDAEQLILLRIFMPTTGLVGLLDSQ
ncbi:putative RNA recognition motif domain, nucleotide-binding alpha-beta plait domain superfamily [Helianthus annuus]|nr:putative RNA recognition motif domain, nucleotide-binding alpha-beta plait domain superfamily [Helianthus annuus]